MNKKGFTLVETVLFITLVALVASGFLLLFARHFSQISFTSQIPTALFLADGKLEVMLGDYYDPLKGMAYLVNGNYGEENPLATYGRTVSITTVTVSGSQYQCTDTPSAAGDGVKCLTVRVAALENSLLTVQSRLILWKPVP